MTKWIDFLYTAGGAQRLYLNITLSADLPDSDAKRVVIDKIPETQEEVEMFYMINPSFNVGWVKELLSTINDRDVEWERGSDLARIEEVFMYRCLDKNGIGEWR